MRLIGRKSTVSAAILAFGFACQAAGQSVSPACGGERAGWTAMLDAEEAFGIAARHSVRGAFLENLAEDAWVLEPGPVPARPFYSATKDSADTLEWYPTIAEVADDLGFTSGPWVYTVAHSGSRVYGHFLTIWQRDRACHWKVKFDGGISHDAPTRSATKLPPDARTSFDTPRPAAKLIAGDAPGAAMAAFQKVAVEDGLPAGLHTYARNGNFSFYRHGAEPQSLDAAAAYLGELKLTGDWREATHGRSADASLAYAVGEWVNVKQHSSQAYVEIWQYDPKVANWGLRILLLSPLPPAAGQRQKNSSHAVD